MIQHPETTQAPASQPATPAASGHPDRPPRLRTYLKGKVVYGDGAFTIDCAIRDISDGGAKIVFDEHQALPTEIFLIVVKQGVAYKAKVVWNKYPARGLKFFEAYPLDEPLPSGKGFLHRLWVDLLARASVI